MNIVSLSRPAAQPLSRIPKPRPEWATVYSFAYSAVDLVTGRGMMSPLPTGGFKPGPGGLGLQFATTDVSTASNLLVPGLGGAITAVMIVDFLSTTTSNNFLFGEAAPSVGAYNWGFYESSAGLLRGFVHNGTSGVNTDSGYNTSAVRGPQVLVMTYGGGDGFVRVYIGGTEFGTAQSQTGNIQRNAAATLGVQRWNTAGANMRLYAGAVMPRRLTAVEIKERFSTPDSSWDAIFQQRKLFVPNSTAVAGAYTLTAETAAFTLTGNAAGLTVARTLTAETAAFTLTGNDAGLTVARKLTADTATFTLTGNDANLVYTPVGTYTLTADTAAFTLTGNAAGLTVARVLTAESGAFALTGNAATLTYRLYVPVLSAPSAFNVTSTSAQLRVALTFEG